MTIQYFVRNVYGQSSIYLIGDVAKNIEILTRRKTVTMKDFGALRALGFELEQVLDPQYAEYA